MMIARMTNMKSKGPLLKWLELFSTLLLTFAVFTSLSQPADTPKDKPTSAAGDLVPLNLKLPPPAFKGTPKDIQLSSYVEPLSDKPRPPMMVPAGLKNLAAGK